MSFRRGLVPFSDSACLSAASRRERPFTFKPSRRLSRRTPSLSIMLFVRASPYLACVALSQGHNQQVHSGDVRCVVMQKGTPSLAWWPAPLDHVLGDARLRDLKPQLEQLAMDARSAPKRILNAH